MKKKLLLFAMALLCLALCACGAGGESKPEETPTTTEPVVDESGYVDFTAEQLVGYVERVELTLDNWDDYFADFCKEEVTTNSFGEVSSTKYWHGFYLKEDVIASCHGVAFKFTGVTKYRYEGLDHRPYEELDYKQNLRRYGFEQDGTYTEVSEDFDKEYCVVDFRNDSDSILRNPGHYQGSQYTKFECIAVTGELYIYHLPDEVNSFTIDGYPKGDEYYVNGFKCPGDEIAELYAQYHS